MRDYDKFPRNLLSQIKICLREICLGFQQNPDLGQLFQIQKIRIYHLGFQRLRSREIRPSVGPFRGKSKWFTDHFRRPPDQTSLKRIKKTSQTTRPVSYRESKNTGAGYAATIDNYIES